MEAIRIYSDQYKQVLYQINTRLLQFHSFFSRRKGFIIKKLLILRLIFRCHFNHKTRKHISNKELLMRSGPDSTEDKSKSILNRFMFVIFLIYIIFIHTTFISFCLIKFKIEEDVELAMNLKEDHCCHCNLNFSKVLKQLKLTES